MEVALTASQEEQRDLWDPPLSAEVLALIKEDQCGVCDNLHLSSAVVAHGHYHGRKHEKRLLKLLAEKGGEMPTKKGFLESDDSSWQQSAVQMDPSRCKLCKVDFTGPACADLHYAGLKHRKRVNAVYQMAEFNFELEEEVGNYPTFDMSSAFNQLSEEDKEKMDEMNRIEAYLAEAKTDTVLPNEEANVAKWSGLTEQDIELYNENWESSPFFCSTCNTDCQNQGALDMHLKGKPHAKKVNKSKITLMLHFFKARLQEGATDTLFCDLCKIKCSGSENMKDHLASKKHRVNFWGVVHSYIRILAVEGTEKQRGQKVGTIWLRALWYRVF